MKYLVCSTVVVALLAAGCGEGTQPSAAPSAEPTEAVFSNPPLPTEPDNNPPPTSTEPPTSSEPAASEGVPAAAPSDAGRVELWFVREPTPSALWVEPETVAIGTNTRAVARAAFARLVDATPKDPGLRNLLPEGTRLLNVALDGETLTVDVDFPNDDVGLGAAYEGTAFAQIVHTGAQFPTVRRVRVLEEGRIPPSGHFLWEGAMRPQPESVSPVIVTSPHHAAVVEGGNLAVKGTADVFEATVLLTLRDPDGKVHKKTFATATCGTGCRGTWKKTFRNVTAPGEWTLIAGASDPSDGEGNPPFKTKRTFTVR